MRNGVTLHLLNAKLGNAMSQIAEKQGSAIGATLLITGCCIGAGMIGLPVVSAKAGFIPSMLAMLL